MGQRHLYVYAGTDVAMNQHVVRRIQKSADALTCFWTSFSLVKRVKCSQILAVPIAFDARNLVSRVAARDASLGQYMRCSVL